MASSVADSDLVWTFGDNAGGQTEVKIKRVFMADHELPRLWRKPHSKFSVFDSTLSKPIRKNVKMRKNCTHHHVVNKSEWAVIGAANTAAPLHSTY